MIWKLFRSSYVQSVGYGLITTVAMSACTAAGAQVTTLQKQLDRLDVAVSGMGVITKGVSGNNYLSQAVTENASTTVGALVQIRYTKSPLMGLEFNYGYARFTESFSGSPFSSPASTGTPFAVQSSANEYTLGYLAHLPSLLGVQPFASGGAGVTAFKPTPNGGQGLPEQGRLSVYYDLGVEDELTRFFGIRAQFRQSFYKGPDFGQNYLTLNQRTFTTEPSIGFYVKF